MVDLNPTKSFLFDLKCTKIAGPDPAGGTYSAPPDPLAVRREERGDGGEEREEEGREGKEMGGEETSRFCPQIQLPGYAADIQQGR